MLIIDAEQLRSLLPMGECIDVMASAMADASHGKVNMPPRLILPVDDSGVQFFVMPAASAVLDAYGAKLVSLTPENRVKGLPTIRGQFVLFEKSTGAPVALIDAAALTAIRTAAASGLATQLLARADARTCGIFGTGVQAATHLEAMCAVRRVAEILVWGRDFDRAKTWATEQARVTGRRVIARRDPAEVAACDLICTVTASPVPILMGEWVRPGAHVNVVGCHSPTGRETDSALIVRSKVYVDRMESALKEAGDLMIPLQEGAVMADHFRGEIGQVVAGQLRGRESDDEITLYKSLGIAAQDLYAGLHAFRKAQAVNRKSVRS